MNELDVFTAALEIADPAERSAYLEQACAGNATLRRRIEVILKASENAGGFLDPPAAEQVAAALQAGEDPERTEGERTDAVENAWQRFLGPSAREGALGRLGHYDVLEVVGQGGFGIVLKAFDARLQRVVAIKMLAPHLASIGTARRRFIREAQAAAAVRHDNVIDLHGVEEAPLPYLVMEFVAGQTLQEKIEAAGPLGLKEVLRIGHQIACALAAAHAQGLIHRDIKPSNVLLENGVERVKVTDFGLARAVDDASLTQSGVIAGTPMYMAPEQAAGEPLDHRADLFIDQQVDSDRCPSRDRQGAGIALRSLTVAARTFATCGSIAWGARCT